ncbi:MAG: chitobiase/beta-hexosaminidase C-terminal domain-containing protein [Bacteroidaceae bacterium]|nr:chitobiase/beta-hexosaminidase C-terminal domain-containing protein [Bacteroidaceae bacterium]
MKKTTLNSLLTMLLLFLGSYAWADTYTHTFITSDIPENTTETSFTLSDVNWILTMDGGKVSVFSNDLGTHFGTNNATCNSVKLSTEGIPGTITSITVEASRGKNLIGAMEVTVNETNYTLSGGATTTDLTQENKAYEFTGEAEGEIAIVWTKDASANPGTNKGAFYIKKITIEYDNSGGGGVTVVKPVITPNGGTFTTAQEVTITAEEGCTIYYTLDGTDPTTESTQYEAPFTVSEDCTVKAIACDADDNTSNVASAEFKFFTPYSTIGELCAASTDTETSVFVDFNNWICTGVKGSNAYFTDGTNGILVYQSGHGFKQNDVLTGTAQVTLVTYNECPEVKNLKSTTTGVTVTEGEGATPQTDIAIADLEKNMQGNLITLEGVTYSSGVFVDDDDNTITPYGTFITLPELLDGKTYNVTGVVIWYKSGGIWEIAPRTADEIVLVTNKIAPESSWSVEEEVVDINGASTAVFTTNSDGAVSYDSSDEEVATIDENGVITLVGKGITTITAYVEESDTYLPDSKSFTLTVTKDGYAEATFSYTDEDIAGKGTSGGGSGFSATRNDVLTLNFTNAFGAAQHIKVYGNGANDIEKSNVELSVVDGYAISQIVFTITNSQDYRSIWEDQFGAQPQYSEDSLTVTWAGMQNKVVLNNLYNTKTLRPKQAQIRTIDVTYIKLQDTEKTITIGETGLATFCSDVKCVLSGAEQFAIAGAITGAEGAVLTVDTLTSSIPAEVGVLLMGAPGEYKVYTHPDLEEDTPEANLLTGVLADTEAPVGSYVLQEQDAVGFFQVVEGAPVTIPAGHAFLTIEGATAPVFFFTEEDYVTGISEVSSNVNDAAIYDLSGRRVGKMQKGIYIVGGKKILR